MGLGGVATAALPSVVRLQMVFSDRLGGGKCFCISVGQNLMFTSLQISDEPFF